MQKEIPKYSMTIVFLLAFFISLQGQVSSIGTPFIKNYSRMDYHAGQQNWMIDQGADGRLYFANNDGLLEFDGLNWNLYPLPNKTIVRSVLVDDDGKIYAGGFNEFGYFMPDAQGQLVYHTLVDKLPAEDRNFDEIWRIHLTPDGIVFQSFTQLFIYKEGRMQTLKAPSRFHFSFFVNGQLLVVDMEEGILRYTMGTFFHLVGTDLLTGIEILTILPVGNKFLLATAEKGIYLYDGNKLEEWSNPSADFLKQNQVYTANLIPGGYLAFGTVQNGLLICSLDGIPVQNINRFKGLQNNTVLCIKMDEAKNLWLGTDNGIDYLEINSPLSILSYENGISAGYTAILHNDYLYLGTNQGVFYKKWEDFVSNYNNEKFLLIEATAGQVWTLQVIDNQLFCGSKVGTFIINGSVASQISDIPGCWTYVRLIDDQDKIVAGTYSGLLLFKKSGNSWEFDKRIKGFHESSRLIELDSDGTLWMSHGFKGVFHLHLTEGLDSVQTVDFYDETSGFNTNLGINVTRIKQKIYFTASEGIYYYNAENDAFEKDAALNGLLDVGELIKIREDGVGNLWYFAKNEVGVMRLQEDGAFTKIHLPFRQIEEKLIGGFEFVIPIDEKNVLFGASNGFILYNPSQYKDYRLPFSTYISEVSLIYADSVIFSGHPPQAEISSPALQFRNNQVYFAFAANDFENPEKTEFSTFLEGYDTEWSNWEIRQNREFTNLSEGDYTFYVKARNIYETETEASSYKFVILPPWERTIAAFIVYAIGGLLIIGFLLILIRRKIERSKNQEKKKQLKKFKEREEKMQRERLEAEKEIIRLRNEKLREQMRIKDKELANSTLEMIQKNKLLTKIKNDLKKSIQNTKDADLKNQINSLTKKINKELDNEKQWEVFETHFENVHEAFLKRLKNQYPELSPRELKLCAYLRLNISSKEIAVLMNISTRGVEISRYRLRKKLALNRNENLTEFILTF